MEKFVNDLNTTPRVEKVPFMAGDLPEDFVARPEEFNKLLAMLIETKRSELLAITAALHGASSLQRPEFVSKPVHREAPGAARWEGRAPGHRHGTGEEQGK